MNRPGYDQRRGQLIPGGLIGRELQRAAMPESAGPAARVVGTVVGTGPAPQGGTPVSLPPVNFPPDGAFPVDLIGDDNIAPAASAVLVTSQVPATRTLRVAAIGFGADDETALRFLTWQLRVDTVPTPGYFAVPATIGTIRSPAEIFLSVPGPATVTVFVSTDAAANVTYRYIARIRGWLFGRLQEA